MDYAKKIGKVSATPTKPGVKIQKNSFDIADLYSGPASETESASSASISFDEKMRKAYYWIVNYAIITPFYDIEFNDEPARSFAFGDSKSLLNLPTGQSYSSFILLPLLSLVTKRKCLFVGGPGRGKTASAILMGLLAGYPLKEIKRAIQHGQPQMTISDLLGNPLPSDLMQAKSMDEIQIAWRKWLGMRVKIIDEYNRIPTRTQSALLTVMSDNYAEIMDQIYECPDAAWYLTANDDAGGGTYQVIEALQDRIDIVVRALHFNTRFLKELLLRVENGIKPEKMVPPEIIFTEEEITRINQEILEVQIPPQLMRRIEFFASQFELCEFGAEQFEYKTKDNVKVSGVSLQEMSQMESGKDQSRDIGSQTRNGLSVRAFTTCLIFIKAMAYFRGESTATFEDVKNIIPFVLHDKLTQNTDSLYFQKPENVLYRIDRISWIRRLFEISSKEYDKIGLDKNDIVKELLERFEKGLEGVTGKTTKNELALIERELARLAESKKLYGPMYDDILTLKYLHQRYTNYLKWLEWKK